MLQIMQSIHLKNIRLMLALCPFQVSRPRQPYLGYDPFNDPTLGSPKRNEPSCVAFLSKDAPVTLGHKMKRNRLKLRKTRKQMASELGVSVKTLWGWETDRWQPTSISEIC
jgi:DNA-binding XRE family transcriptional regulator